MGRNPPPFANAMLASWVESFTYFEGEKKRHDWFQSVICIEESLRSLKKRGGLGGGGGWGNPPPHLQTHCSVHPSKHKQTDTRRHTHTHTYTRQGPHVEPIIDGRRRLLKQTPAEQNKNCNPPAPTEKKNKYIQQQQVPQLLGVGILRAILKEKKPRTQTRAHTGAPKQTQADRHEKIHTHTHIHTPRPSRRAHHKWAMAVPQADSSRTKQELHPPPPPRRRTNTSNNSKFPNSSSSGSEYCAPS